MTELMRPFVRLSTVSRHFSAAASLLAVVLAAPVAADGLASATPEAINKARESITEAELRDIVNFLASDTLEGRRAGSDGSRAAAAYITDHFKTLGFQPVGDDYRREFGDRGYQNVMAQWGTGDLPPVIISAHYDHVGRGFRRRVKPRHRVVTAGPPKPEPPPGPIHNGADDNASGTSLVLEIAEACAQLPAPTKRPVIFALWDGEELGLLGSKAYAKETAENPAALAIVCDMVGRASCDQLYIYGSTTVEGLEDVISREAVSPLKPVYLHSHLPRSDHWPFYQAGTPYLMFHTGLHPDYHKPADDPDLLNYKTMLAITRTAFNVLMEVSADDFELSLNEASKDLPMTMMPPQSECPPEPEKLEPEPAEPVTESKE